ncbi:MAG: serine hydrolase domain-containing protein [Blastomonas fulva]
MALVTAAWLVPHGAAASAQTLPGCDAAIAYSQARDGVAVLVLEDGRIACASAGVDVSHELWSGTKSLIGLVAAAAVQDGLLTLDEAAAATITEWRDVPQKNAITIRHLLSMTSGHPSAVGRPQGYAASLDVPLTQAPGTAFQYGPTPLQIFGEILKRKLSAGGQDADPRAYAERRLLQPLGVTVADWRNGPDGQPLMPQGAVMSAKQWARLGEFVRAGGVQNGKPLVDGATLRALFDGSTPNPAYGLTWWLPRATPAKDAVTAATDITQAGGELPQDMVLAAGAGDQRLYVIPSRKLTIVRQARLNMANVLSGKASGWSDRQFLGLLLGS